VHVHAPRRRADAPIKLCGVRGLRFVRTFVKPSLAGNDGCIQKWRHRICSLGSGCEWRRMRTHMGASMPCGCTHSGDTTPCDTTKCRMTGVTLQSDRAVRCMMVQRFVRSWSYRHGLEFGTVHHPGGNPGSNLKSISHRCYLFEVAFVWELTEETMNLPLGCFQGGLRGRVFFGGRVVADNSLSLFPYVSVAFSLSFPRSLSISPCYRSTSRSLSLPPFLSLPLSLSLSLSVYYIYMYI